MRHRSIVLFIFILLLQMACADNRTMAEATAVTPLTNPTVIKRITGSPTATVELTAVSTATLAPTTTPTPAATSTPLPLPTSDSSQSNDWSNHPRISGDGQVVVFESNATNLVPEDNNDSTDIFVYDREQGQVARVSGTSDGTEANENSFQPTLSANGRFVAFVSLATNLVSNDTNNSSDVFVYDRNTDSLERISVASDGSEGNDESDSPALSADGRFVVFVSEATNLDVSLEDTTDLKHIFVHDRERGETKQIDVNGVGQSANGHSLWPHISADGRYISFASRATNLTDNFADTEELDQDQVFVYDADSNEMRWVAQGVTPLIAADGSRIVYLRFVEGSGLHLFVYDMATAVHTDVTWVVGGIHGRPEPYDLDISADGQSLVFGAVARNETTGEESQQTDIFLYDGQTGAIELISAGADAGSFDPAISADGSFIVFASRATNLVSGDTNQTADIFLYDQQTGQMERINLPPGRLSAK